MAATPQTSIPADRQTESLTGHLVDTEGKTQERGVGRAVGSQERTAEVY